MHSADDWSIPSGVSAAHDPTFPSRHAAASRRRPRAVGCASAAPPSFIGAGALPTAADGAAVNAGGLRCAPAEGFPPTACPDGVPCSLCRRDSPRWSRGVSPGGVPRRRAVAGHGYQGSGAGHRSGPRSPHAATPERGPPRRVAPPRMIATGDRKGRPYAWAIPQGHPLRVPTIIPQVAAHGAPLHRPGGAGLRPARGSHRHAAWGRGPFRRGTPCGCPGWSPSRRQGDPARRRRARLPGLGCRTPLRATLAARCHPRTRAAPPCGPPG
jgi:hypothetical protein